MANQSRRSFLTLLASVPLLGRLAPKPSFYGETFEVDAESDEIVNVLHYDYEYDAGRWAQSVEVGGRDYAVIHTVGPRDPRHTEGIVVISSTRIDHE